MAEPVLSLKEFGVGFNKRIILSSITLDIPETGIMILMGPCGSGKSTLLKAIVGVTQANPANRIWGKAVYAGNELFSSAIYPALVSQNMRLMISSILENIVFGLPERSSLTQPQQRKLAERFLIEAGLDKLCDQLNTQVSDLELADQRQLAILRQTVSNPRLLCIDEPTTGLDEESTRRMLDYIRLQAKKRAILIITHNQQLARELGGYTALLAGGWIQEVQKTTDFFASPISDAAKSFVDSGTCALPSPDAKPEEVAPEWVSAIRKPPKEATEYKSHVLGPNGFMWLKKGRLAGTPRPGLLVDKEQDLTALKRVGITHLISLTIRKINTKKCKQFNISVIRFPIPDMQPPSLEQALDICQQVGNLLQGKNAIAVHCRAGLGRTGTVLAAQLIFEGKSALAALEQVRSIESRWIQSESQVAFLEEFERFLQLREHSNNDNTVDASVA